MNLVLLFVVVLGAICVTAIAQRKGLQPALVIVLVGFAASFIPGIPRLDIPSEVILGAVLPPLLYSAALNFSFFSFMRSIGPILGLGVGLVVVTAAAVGLVGNLLVPSLTLGTAILLGAIVAPPDAVTAVSIGKKLGLPRRVMDILTGESLVNDAAALTLFTIAVAAIAGTHTLYANPFALFIYAAGVGSFLGLVLGGFANLLRHYVASSGLQTALGLMLPFAAYFIAEQLEASGVLAVVFAGFTVGTGAIRDNYQTRIQERQVWSSLDVLLETFVFAYMGLQLRFVIEEVTDAGYSTPLVFLAGGAILVTVMLIRPLWVFGMIGRRRLFEKLREATEKRARARGFDPDEREKLRLEARERGYQAALAKRGRARGDHRPRERVRQSAMTIGEGAVVSWTGMRGVVTIAAASGIPLVTASGEDFPGRAVIQAIAFTVAVGTLLIQGGTLPAVIRRSKLPDDAATSKADAAAVAAVTREAADAIISDFASNPPRDVNPAVYERVSEMAKRRAASDEETAAREIDEEAKAESNRVLEALLQRMISAQRTALMHAMREGRIEFDAATSMFDQLDIQEAGLAARQSNRL